jgi:hypothetical protein
MTSDVGIHPKKPKNHTAKRGPRIKIHYRAAMAVFYRTIRPVKKMLCQSVEGLPRRIAPTRSRGSRKLQRSLGHRFSGGKMRQFFITQQKSIKS